MTTRIWVVTFSVFIVCFPCMAQATYVKNTKLDPYKELRSAVIASNLYWVSTRSLEKGEEHFVFVRYRYRAWVKRYDYYPTQKTPSNENNGFSYWLKVGVGSFWFPKYVGMRYVQPTGDYGVLLDGRVFVSVRWAYKNGIVAMRRYNDWLLSPTLFVPYENSAWKYAVAHARYFVASPWRSYSQKDTVYFCICAKNKVVLSKKTLLLGTAKKHHWHIGQCPLKYCPKDRYGITSSGLFFVQSAILPQRSFISYRVSIFGWTLITVPMTPFGY